MSWQSIVQPALFGLPAEMAHHTAMHLFCKWVSIPAVADRLAQRYRVSDPRLTCQKFSLTFPNPVGLAAGFDKDAHWFRPLAVLGFGSIEIGTVTGQAQPGNPKPRLFRLPRDKALINRMGFNSSGCEAVADTLARQRQDADLPLVLGVNIGKSKVVALNDAPAEHQKSFETLFDYGDYFTINVSSPNTPQLRELQNREHLIAVIEAVQESNRRRSARQPCQPKPLLLKIAPDLSDAQIDEIAVVARQQGLSGIIATNTTIDRHELKTDQATVQAIGDGGLSGQPLRSRSRQVVARLYRQLRGEIPIVGVGGIMNGFDAWQMIAAGADLIQLYTGFVYGGPGVIRDINRELLRQLESHRLDHISEAVGRACDQ